jgi:hypothetical protein
MVFNATFNNISAISCRSVLLVEETRVPLENYRHDIAEILLKKVALNTIKQTNNMPWNTTAMKHHKSLSHVSVNPS